jgi:hypothetical protein
LDLGDSKDPLFETFRIKEFRAKHKYANMEFNVLCLCPNCHGLLKYGGGDLIDIVNVAKKALAHEIAPEWIEERKGDYYSAKIVIAGTDARLYFRPGHMQKIAWLLEAKRSGTSKNP